MSEYIISVIAAASVVALGSFISYSGKGDKKTASAAMSVILLYTVITPIISFVSDFTPSDVGDFFDELRVPEEKESEYYDVAKDAFCDGIKKMVCEEFSLSSKDVSVSVSGFQLEDMRAQRVKIILSGRAALADARRIAASVTDAGLGECEVEILLA
ncbi:MAG: hypothetical protein IJ515_04035 [Clostridia bacterium]|nr:hypothetical protein [Clostridia bacterium]